MFTHVVDQVAAQLDSQCFVAPHAGGRSRTAGGGAAGAGSFLVGGRGAATSTTARVNPQQRRTNALVTPPPATALATLHVRSTRWFVRLWSQLMASVTHVRRRMLRRT